jgi:hypothetical protein
MTEGGGRYYGTGLAGNKEQRERGIKRGEGR